MQRSYNLKSKPKKTSGDTVIVRFCAFVTIIVVLITCMYCNYIKMTRSTTDKIDGGDDDVVATNIATSTEMLEHVTEKESLIGSMAMAGNTLADKQNALIAENDKYLVTMRNAAASGYYDKILMTDKYKQLIEDFNKKYMKKNPYGASGVLWSESGVWEFQANYDFSSDLYKSMPAVWLCYDKNDTDKIHPYAIVTATYITASDSFENPVLYKTEWYPSNSSVADKDAIIANGMPNDVTVSADQCGDDSAANGSNDDGKMTDEQKKIRDELQKLIDANKAKENAVSISH